LIEVFPGGHFFVKSARRDMVRAIDERLRSGVLSPGGKPRSSVLRSQA
jgi:surfactin synthase thioesterase subunit